MMKSEEIIKALKCLRVQTGSLACMGCGREHDCGVHGCAIMRQAADLIERLEKEKADAQWIPATEPPKEWKDGKTGYLKNYLISCVDSGVDVGSYHALAGCWLCCGLPVTVTHWMPLPKAPEVK